KTLRRDAAVMNDRERTWQHPWVRIQRLIRSILEVRRGRGHAPGDEGDADGRATRSGVTMARAGPHPRRARHSDQPRRPQPRRPQPRRAMRWADVYVCTLADGVALRNRCP